MNPTDQNSKAVRTLTDAMTSLGLLDAKDAHRAVELLAVADEANATARNWQTLRQDEAKRAAHQLIEKGFDAAKVVKAAATMPSVEAVELVATEARASAVHAAHALVFARVREVPAAITAQYDLLRERAEKVEEALTNVRTPQAAIDAGKTAEWQALADIRATYSTLSGWVQQFRDAGLIPSPAGSARGLYWNQRKPHDSAAFHQAVAIKDRDGGRSLAMLTLRSEPYVPATKDEAAATANLWADAEVSA